MADTDSTQTDQIEANFQSVLSCEPAISFDGVADIEEFCTSQDFGIWRRSGLAIGMQSGAWFKKLSEDKEMAALFAGTLEEVADHLEILDAIRDVLHCAVTRCSVALCNHEEYNPLTREFNALAALPKKGG